MMDWTEFETEIQKAFQMDLGSELRSDYCLLEQNVEI